MTISQITWHSVGYGPGLACDSCITKVGRVTVRYQNGIVRHFCRACIDKAEPNARELAKQVIGRANAEKRNVAVGVCSRSTGANTSPPADTQFPDTTC